VVVQIDEVMQVDEVTQADDLLGLPDLEVTEKETTCEACNAMKTDISQLKGKVTLLKNKLATNQQQWAETFKELQEQNRLHMLFKLTTLLKTSQIFHLKTLRGLKIHKLSTIRQRTMKRRIMTTVGAMIWMTLHGTLKKLTVTTNKLKTKTTPARHMTIQGKQAQDDN